MFQQVNFYFIALVSLCTVLVISVTGCGEDNDNEWVGTWELETVDGESIQVQIEALELLFEFVAGGSGEDEIDLDISYTDELTFDDDGAWHRETTIVAPNEDGNIVTLSYKHMGTYSLSGPNFTIKLESVQGYDPDLEIFREIDFEYVDTETGTTLIGYVDTETGTWLINGDTLTLTSDNGQVFGLKKK